MPDQQPDHSFAATDLTQSSFVVSSNDKKACAETRELKTTIAQLTKQLDVAKQQLASAEARHRSTETQLQSERRRFEDLYENAPDLYVSVCPKTRTVTQCNQTLLKTLGYNRDEVIGHDLMNLYHASCQSGVAIAFKAFVRNGEIRETELVLKHKNGSPLDVSLRVTAVRDESGKIIFSRSAWRDISNQKRIEKQLRQREQELGHYGRISTLGAIASQLAHELNQPLGAITNYISGCRVSMAEGEFDPVKMMEIAAKAEAEARRASEIIKRLRRMAQNKPIEVTNVDLHGAIQEAFALMNPVLKEQEVHVDLKLSNEPLIIRGDRIQLEQVIVNLLTNSVQALRKISDQKRIQVTTAELNSSVTMTFADNGCGFDSDPASFFEAFTSNSPDGMGLGLSICRSIVRSLGGKISARNNHPSGAIFEIVLPLKS